ncbi:hypothetical protein J8A87_19560 [Vibrio parahaemolyticus]|uniref:5' nucleotidase, NT5C type n=1 Tax=Vibrio sp. Vb0587 TaxID=3074626 RepID=UPI0029645551|nr:hypothetical protein [Vibrio sp. Vb0587]MBE4779597.1 hypothetical protein [Vibrio parahaemolyticus]MCF9166655.1 hypothetical protein [Vibrio parahaemolyticus]MDW1967798.1 hypothetical protein [Vibrio sp. Vb0587]
MNKKEIIHFDMDNTLIDFVSAIDELSDEIKREYEGRLDEVPGIFSLMKPMPGAIEAVKKLSQYFECHVASTSPWENPSAWSDKLICIKTYFPKDFYKRLTLTHNKHNLRGEYLIDDRLANGAGEFEGELIRFGSEEFPDWESVTEYLINKYRTKN